VPRRGCGASGTPPPTDGSASECGTGTSFASPPPTGGTHPPAIYAVGAATGRPAFGTNAICRRQIRNCSHPTSVWIVCSRKRCLLRKRRRTLCAPTACLLSYADNQKAQKKHRGRFCVSNDTRNRPLCTCSRRRQRPCPRRTAGHSLFSAILLGMRALTSSSGNDTIQSSNR
jgi:hypothetical protein